MKQIEIARKLNISQQTVSRFLRQPELVKETTALQIRQLMDQSGYEPNELANRIKSNRLEMIGIILPSIRQSYFPVIMEGIQQVAAERNWQVTVTCSNAESIREEEQIRLMRQLRFGGMIIVPSLQGKELFRRLIKLKWPLVLIDQHLADVPSHYVGTDDLLGAKLAMEHLVGLNHQRIGMVLSNPNLPALQKRLEGYHQAIRRYRLPKNDRWIFPGSYDWSRGREVLTQWMALPKHQRPTALFCDNDTIAAGIQHAALAQGMTLPVDLSLVGYAGHDWTALLPIALTTVQQPAWEIGIRSARILFDVIEGRLNAPKQEALPPELRVRASTTTVS